MGTRSDGAAAETLAVAAAAEVPPSGVSTVAGLFRRWHGLVGELDVDRAPDAAIEAVLERRLRCRVDMAGAQSRSLAELRMKVAVLHAEFAASLEPEEVEDAANLALLGSVLADLAALERIAD